MPESVDLASRPVLCRARAAGRIASRRHPPGRRWSPAPDGSCGSCPGERGRHPPRRQRRWRRPDDAPPGAALHDRLGPRAPNPRQRGRSGGCARCSPWCAGSSARHGGPAPPDRGDPGGGAHGPAACLPGPAGGAHPDGAAEAQRTPFELPAGCAWQLTRAAGAHPPMIWPGRMEQPRDHRSSGDHTARRAAGAVRVGPERVRRPSRAAARHAPPPATDDEVCWNRRSAARPILGCLVTVGGDQGQVEGSLTA